MRLAVVALLMLGGCGANPAKPPAPDAATAGLRGAAAPNSPDARAAMATVERYFSHLKARDYAAAYRMWDDGGRAAAPNLAAFTQGFAPYAIYEPTAGRPTAVTVRGREQYVLVSASLYVKRRNGDSADRDGSVMLRRSIDPQDPDAAKRDWRIWATDIRARS